jgi:hypothetical protein
MASKMPPGIVMVNGAQEGAAIVANEAEMGRAGGAASRAEEHARSETARPGIGGSTAPLEGDPLPRFAREPGER